jgi:hypothetical protein
MCSSDEEKLSATERATNDEEVVGSSLSGRAQDHGDEREGVPPALIDDPEYRAHHGEGEDQDVVEVDGDVASGAEQDIPRDLILGLIGAVGTDLRWVEHDLVRHLAALGFDAQTLSLSERMEIEYSGTLFAREAVPYDDYVFERMTAWERAESALGDPRGACAARDRGNPSTPGRAASC